MKKDDISIKYAKVAKCVPMPEVNRQFYNPFDYRALKSVIKKDGFNPAYPVRVLWNEEIEVYEVFDGIHRTQIARELGISKIPVIDETVKTARSKAIEQGIKANQFRAPYNPMDLANSLYELGKSISKEKGREHRKGRPVTLSIKAVSKVMVMSERSVKEFIRLRKLPKDVQALIGRGKLKFNVARFLCSYIATPFEKHISPVAEVASNEKMSLSNVVWYMKSVLNKTADPKKDLCSECARTLKHVKECPTCATKFRNEDLEDDEETKAENKGFICVRVLEDCKKCPIYLKDNERKDCFENGCSIDRKRKK